MDLIQVVIRAATLADTPTLCQIEAQTTAYPWTLALYESCFSERYFNFVLTVDGIIKGFYIAEFIADAASLFNIVVAVDSQGHGLGKMLLQHFIQQAESRDAFECWLEVRVSNTHAIGLYQSHGFHQTGKRRNYYPTATGHEDAILMGLPLRLG